MRIIPDWKEFIELLNSESVQYLVIGGWAFNRYAEPRMTGDLDLFFASTPENQAALRRVLQRFGFGTALPPSTVPLFEKKVLMLGRPPNRIDLLSEISGVCFAEAWESRESGDLDGVPVSYISRAKLIQNKRASGRKKDLADLELLEE